MEEVKVQFMDRISFVINEGASRNSEATEPSTKATDTEATIQKLTSRVQLLEQQFAACLTSQPNVCQVMDRCDALEHLLKAIKKEVDRRLAEFTKKLIPARPGKLSCTQDLEEDLELQNSGLVSEFDDTNWQPTDDDEQDTESYENEFDAVITDLDVKPFLCEFCPEIIFDSTEGLTQHYKNQHSIYGTTEADAHGDGESGVSESAAASEDVAVGGQSHLCPECGRTFSSGAHLRRHVKSMHKPPTISCEFCEKLFHRRDKLLIHKRRLHYDKIPEELKNTQKPVNVNTLPPPPLSCTEGCGLTFPSQEQWRQHLLTSHRQTKPFKCDECEGRYSSRDALQEHKERKHAKGQIRAPCPVCGRRFFWRDINKHLRRVHNKPQTVRPRRELKPTGIPKEKNQVCEECGARYAASLDLQIHQRTHTGERPYACSRCDKRFRSLATLQGHGLLHTGKPFVCDECGRAFVKASILRLHKRSHENDSQLTLTEGVKDPLQRQEAAEAHQLELEKATPLAGTAGPGGTEAGQPSTFASLLDLS